MSKFSAEEKVRIVLDWLRYPEGITALWLVGTKALREEEISRHRYSNTEEARERIRTAIERYGTRRYPQGIGDIKPIERDGREQGILARRVELREAAIINFGVR